MRCKELFEAAGWENTTVSQTRLHRLRRYLPPEMKVESKGSGHPIQYPERMVDILKVYQFMVDEGMVNEQGQSVGSGEALKYVGKHGWTEPFSASVGRIWITFPGPRWVS